MDQAPKRAERVAPSEEPRTQDGEQPVADSFVDFVEGEFVLPLNLILSHSVTPAPAPGLAQLPGGSASGGTSGEFLAPVAFDATGIDRGLFPSQTTLFAESASAAPTDFSAIVAETQFQQLTSASLGISSEATGAIGAIPVVNAAIPTQPANVTAGIGLPAGVQPIDPVQPNFVPSTDQPPVRIAKSPPSVAVNQLPQTDAIAAGAVQTRISSETDVADALGINNVFASGTQPAHVAAAAAVEAQVEVRVTDVSAEAASSGEGDVLEVTAIRTSAQGGVADKQSAFAPTEPIAAAATANSLASAPRPTESGAVIPKPTSDESAGDAEVSSSRSDLSDLAAAGFRSVYRNAAVQELPRGLERITGQVADAIVTQADLIEVGGTVTLDTILDPPDLGRLHVRLTRTESGLTAHVSAEHGDVQRVIAEHTASIEQTVRTHLKTSEPMQFSLAESPFGNGSSARGGGQEPQRPARLADLVRDAGKPGELHRHSRRSQAEVDVLA